MSKADKMLADQGANITASLGRDRKRFVGCKISHDTFDIELDRIVPDPEQPRKEMDEGELLQLAASLKDRGQLQPCLVRWDGGLEKHVIIEGERRWRAAGIAKFSTLQCVIDSSTPEASWFEASLVANCQRVDLRPIEKAEAYKRLMDHHGWTGKECAEHLHLNQTTVTTTLRLLELPEKEREKVDAGELSFRKALGQVRQAKPKRRPKKKAVAKTTRKIKVAGATVTIAVNRKTLSDVEAAQILGQAVEQLQGEKRKAA